MLQHLKIENFALIPSLELHFSPGFTVFTGETGSGKSILLGALNLILGERADYTVIRDPQQKTIVEGIFTIKEYDLLPFFEANDLDYSDETSIRREITGQGKSRAFINDTPVQLSILKELSEQLVHIHSQHHTLELKSQSFQFDVLDYLCDTMPLRKEFAAKNTACRQLERSLEEKTRELQKMLQDEDYNRFQLSELEKLNLHKTNYSILEQEQEQMDHFDAIKLTFDSMGELLENENQVLEKLNQLKAIIDKNKNLHPFFESASERLKSIYLEVKDLAYEAQNQQGSIEFNPAKKQELENQLSLYNAALFKHGVKEQAELIAVYENFEQQQSRSGQLQEEITEINSRIIKLKQELTETGDKLHSERLSQKTGIEQNIETLLSELKMENCKVIFELEKTAQANAFGFSTLSLNFSPNAGLAPKAIEKSASGGELSRLMLAIQTLLSQKKKLPGLIFDEIDTGVSGEVAQKLGELLNKMGQKMQLMAITHLPQVAAKGQSHFKVQKSSSTGSTVTEVRKLSSEERIQEIARLMSGEEITNAAVENAKALMN
ncbi:MAG: recN [Crocinitomicaceae bacterium]|jgi:DNA repair protein RecN (Recombination protein N)|nr:recN [Crocinitomicaceae bacterium]